MALDKKQVDHLAKLARLKLSKEEKKEYSSQLEGILEYVEKLNELDTEKVEEMQHVADLVNVLREDVVELCEGSVQKRIIEAFPKKTGDLLEVQAVFESRTE